MSENSIGMDPCDACGKKVAAHRDDDVTVCSVKCASDLGYGE